MRKRLKDINGTKWPYVIVPEIYYKKYKNYAFVDEPQQLCQSLEEAERVQNSFERADRIKYVIIKLG